MTKHSSQEKFIFSHKQALSLSYTHTHTRTHTNACINTCWVSSHTWPVAAFWAKFSSMLRAAQDSCTLPSYTFHKTAVRSQVTQFTRRLYSPKLHISQGSCTLPSYTIRKTAVLSHVVQFCLLMKTKTPLLTVVCPQQAGVLSACPKHRNHHREDCQTSSVLSAACKTGEAEHCPLLRWLVMVKDQSQHTIFQVWWSQTGDLNKLKATTKEEREQK